MEVIIENTLEDYERAWSLGEKVLEKYFQKPRYSRELRNFFKAVFILALLASGLILFSRYGVKASIWYVPILVLVVLGRLVWGKLSSPKLKSADAWQKTLPFVFKPGLRSEYKVIDEGFLITTNEGARRLRWEKIGVLLADAQSLVLGETGGSFHLLPRRFFPDPECYPELIETIKSRCVNL